MNKREEYAARMVALRDVMGDALQAETGAAWRVEPMHDNALPEDAGRIMRLFRPEGLGIYLNADLYEGKVRVSGAWPKDSRGDIVYWSDVAPYNLDIMGREPAPEIRVSLDKPADRIAREIARRLLPKLDSAWPRFLARMESVSNSVSDFAKACELLARFGADVRQLGGSSSQGHAYMTGAKGGVVHATVESCGSIGIKISMKPGPETESVIRAILAAS